jgi:hypothetical protein
LPAWPAGDSAPGNAGYLKGISPDIVRDACARIRFDHPAEFERP